MPKQIEIVSFYERSAWSMHRYVCNCYLDRYQSHCMHTVLPQVSYVLLQQITDKGLIEILQTFRLLATLSISGCKEIKDPFQAFISQKQLFSLSVLDLSNTSVNDVSMDHIATLCPGLWDINISNCDNVTDAAITAINSITGIRNFSAAGCKLITFVIGIIPLLYRHGYHLETLNISALDNIDLAAIWYLCPRLKALIMEGCPNVCQTNTYGITNQDYHSYLQRLNLRECTFYHAEVDDDDSQSDCLKVVKKFCGNPLKSLCWSGMEGITDSLIVDCITGKCFKSLIYMEVRNCHSITSDSIEQVIRNCPSLLLLDIRFCQQISITDSKDLKSLANSVNHNITLLWE